MSADQSVTVADLMSRGVQTVEPGAPLDSIIHRLRRIGHEGFPVVDKGRVVGLLTLRDADRALEHGLGSLTVREVMSAGEITLRPDDSVARLERRMVESGWGQIPVIDGDSRLIGIVTRTDLIKYWAAIHPTAEQPPAETIDADQIAAVLGTPAARLIETIARQAQEQQINLYMVGGVVRDLLLKRPNDDIDFVVEGDAIPFAEGLRARYGGQVHSYRPFGTATWILDGTGIDGDGGYRLPDSVDFATARNEFYEHPTALPTVYSGSIKLDLQRRDFTINTLAVMLSPASGRILDYYGGLADLRAGLIRVLHSLSFVDDPTRILRAVRFERRLGFRIEPRTSELIDTALPMLRRITGARVRNELTLMLGEADAAGGFLLLQTRGILKAIHPAFVVPDDLAARFERARSELAPGEFIHTPALWSMEKPEPAHVYWCLLLAGIAPDELGELCTRLFLGKPLVEAIVETARLVQNPEGLTDPAAKPSRVTARLDGTSDLALFAAYIILESLVARDRIWQYANEWRVLRPTTDGRVLRSRGIKPGPCYAIILARLRAARLDGEIGNDEEEKRLLDSLLEEGICDDSAE